VAIAPCEAKFADRDFNGLASTSVGPSVALVGAMRTYLLSCFTVASLAACGLGNGDPTECPEGFVCTPNGEPTPATACVDHEPDPGERIKWRNLLTRGVIALGTPQHAAADVVFNPGDDVTLSAKFAYGPTSKDLEDEEVVAMLRTDRCKAWLRAGSGTTDSDGRVAIDVPGATFPGAGRYDVAFFVRGDLSRVDASVHLIERGAEIVVFDIDGTLTTGDEEIIEGIVDEALASIPGWLPQVVASIDKEHIDKIREVALDPDARIREGAVALVEHYATMGVQPYYLTGRPYLLSNLTRQWLAQHELPAGPLQLTSSLEQSSSMGVAAYKAAAIRELESRLGLKVVAAYGNAQTDICAYADAALPADQTFIVGEHSGEACAGHEPSRAVRDYPAHLAEIQ